MFPALVHFAIMLMPLRQWVFACLFRKKSLIVCCYEMRYRVEIGERKVGKIDVKKQFGAAVRSHRNRLGISQEELAGRASLHRTYISDVERGARNVSLESIHRIANALEIPVASLFSTNHVGVPVDSVREHAA